MVKRSIMGCVCIARLSRALTYSCIFLISSSSGAFARADSPRSFDVGVAWEGSAVMAGRVLAGVVSELEERGVDIRLDIRESLADVAALETAINEFEGSKDAMIILRSGGAELLGRRGAAIPAFIGASTHPVSLGVAEALERPHPNVAGVTYYLPARQRLEAFQQIYPSMRRLLLLVEEGHPSSPLDIEESDAAARELGLQLRVAAGRSRDDLVAAVRSAGEDEVILLGVQALVISHVEDIRDAAGDRILFSYSEQAVQKGALAGLVANDYRLGRMLAGMLIDHLVRGVPMVELSIRTDPEPEIRFNYSLVELYQERIPYAFVQLARGRQLLDGVLQAAPSGVGVIRDGRIVKVNDYVLELTGYRRAELLDESLLIVFPTSAEHQLVMSSLADQLLTESLATVECQWLRKDGQLRHVWLSAAFLDAGMPEAGMIFTVQDITERKELELSLLLSEERYRHLFENPALAMLLIDPETGIIRSANPAAVDFYGWSLGELIGMRIHDINMLSEEEVYEQMAFARDRERQFFEFQHRLADGSIREVAVFSRDVEIASERLLYSIIHDITDQKAIELALARRTRWFVLFLGVASVALLLLSVKLWGNLQLRRLTEMALVEFKTAVEQSQDGIALADLQGTIRFVNRAWADMHGHSAEELVGKNVAVFHTVKEFQQEVLPWLEKIKRDGAHAGEVMHLRADGSEFPAWMTTTLLKSRSGAAIGMMGIARDITEAVEQRQREQFDNRFRTLLADVSRRFAQVRDSGGFDDAVDFALAVFGELFAVDRAYLYRYSEDLAMLDNTHEWCAPGIEPFIQIERDLPTQNIGWWNDRMRELRPVQITNVEELPPEATEERERFIQQGIRSLIAIPIANDQGQPIGFFGFDSVASIHVWPAEQVEMLQILAETIGSSVLRLEKIRQLADSEEQLRTLSDNLLDGVVYQIRSSRLGKKPVFTYVSAGVERTRGLSPDSILEDASVIYDQMIEEDLVEVHRLEEYAKETITPFRAEFRIRHPSGEIRWMMACSSPRLLEDGDLIWDGLEIDITARRCAEENLVKANRDLKAATIRAEAASRAKSEFLANMSHEIRTPMNAIIGFADMLTKDIADERQRQQAGIIAKSGHSLLRLINDILDLSKVEAGKLEVIPEFFPLRPLLDDLRSVFEPQATAKKLTLSFIVSPDVPDMVRLDDTRLRQILFNLIGNAVKFTEAGGVRVEVEPIAAESGKPGSMGIRFAVHDTGIGIPKAFRSHLFEAFEQRPGQDHAKHGGTGLGLAISQRLAKLMAGKIVHQDNPAGVGSVFALLLNDVPVAYERVAPVDADEDQMTRLVFNPPPTVLLVDDVQTNLQLLRFYLEPHGCRLFEANDGKGAIDLLATQNVDMVLTDIVMPAVDGYDLLAHVREEPGCQGIPVIAITAAQQIPGERQSRYRFDAILSKPISKTELLHVMSRYISHEFAAAPDKTELPRSEIADRIGLQRRFDDSFSASLAGLQRTVHVNTAADLGRQIEAAGREHGAPALIRLGTDLVAATQTFDIAGVKVAVERILAFFNGL